MNHDSIALSFHKAADPVIGMSMCSSISKLSIPLY